MTSSHTPEFHMKQVDGRTLRVARWPARTGAGANRPLLFFNGIGANIELMAPLPERLDDREVITFDMPGVGESPDPLLPYRPWMIARIAEQIISDFGHDKVDVMGVSWGGGMAQQFALQYPGRTGQLVLAATSAGMLMVPGKLAALSKMADPRRYTDPEFMLKNFRTLYGGTTDGAGGHADRIKPPSMRGYLGQLAAMLGWTSAPFLPFLGARTLILMGDDDQIVPVANGTILKTLIPNAEMTIINGGGHLFLVNQAEETIGLIRDFLGSGRPLRAVA
ncbi:alpha/beta fold hydrolase [Sandarakinorhabdus oryzae]|uniref:alpha/beta fold hydrolase n=1 Tax=Sandarakinorhabdus oryzae TaxID=2675220 RepID=UPI001F396066|nr:alpha/beta fold hydrolase [Sandarakinorhabdus oryzae]